MDYQIASHNNHQHGVDVNSSQQQHSSTQLQINQNIHQQHHLHPNIQASVPLPSLNALPLQVSTAHLPHILNGNNILNQSPESNNLNNCHNDNNNNIQGSNSNILSQHLGQINQNSNIICNNNNTNNLPQNCSDLNNNTVNNIGENNRWCQLQVQQFWKHNLHCKLGNSKDICGDDKFKEDGDPWSVEAQAAFLGPILWDKTLPYDADLKVPQYEDLDEFLSENNMPDGLSGGHISNATSFSQRSDSLAHSASLSLGLGHVTTKKERSPSPSDCISPDTLNPPSPAESTFSFASSGRDFDPRTRAFSDEELKPQPMIKKSRKQFVPDELKDDKYWARRRKNNIAAKRSRDARRQKENQIAMRARYLEKENATLHQEVEQLKQENMDLRSRLAKFQEV